MKYAINSIQTEQKKLSKRSQNNILQHDRQLRCKCANCINCIQSKMIDIKQEMENQETTRALLSVHGKLMERGLLMAKDFVCVLAVVLVLLVSSIRLYAQDNRDRHIAIEGTEFTIGTLLQEIERQTVYDRGLPEERQIIVDRATMEVSSVVW